MSQPVDSAKKFSILARVALLVTVAMLLALGWAIALWASDARFWACAATGACAVLALWTVFLYARLELGLRNSASNEHIATRIERLESLLEDMARSARKQADLAALSDQSKSLLFRDREIDAFREAIHENLMRQDYASAQALIEIIATRLGYPEEAARLRAEVEASRKTTAQEKIDQAIGRIETIIELNDWSRALRMSQRLSRAFPNDTRVAALPERIEAARVRHKRDLLEAYGEAVRKNDVDRGIELLKELDMYLPPQEAAALQDSARGVFRAKLHMLGVQFAIRVTEGQWSEAVTVGEEIVREFPNTRMAQEVRLKMDSLRARVAAKA